MQGSIFFIKFPEQEQRNDWISRKGKGFSKAFPIFKNKGTDWTSYLGKDFLIGLLTRKQKNIAFLKKEKLSDIGFPG